MHFTNVCFKKPFVFSFKYFLRHGSFVNEIYKLYLRKNSWHQEKKVCLRSLLIMPHLSGLNAKRQNTFFHICVGYILKVRVWKEYSSSCAKPSSITDAFSVMIFSEALLLSELWIFIHKYHCEDCSLYSVCDLHSQG